jgi:hypothetical protein
MVMNKIAILASALALLTVPALAGSSIVTEKPIVVAQGVDVGIGGVGVRVGDRDRDRDRDWRRHHNDRDGIVIKKHHGYDREYGRDRDND